jgi:hypothetical protein
MQFENDITTTVSEMDAAIQKAQRWQRERGFRAAGTTDHGALLAPSVAAGREGQRGDDRPETDEDSDALLGLGSEDTLREYPPVPPPLLPPAASASQVLAQGRLRALLDDRGGGQAADEELLEAASASGLAASDVELLIKETQAQQRSANEAFLHSSPGGGLGQGAGADAGAGTGDEAGLTDLQRLQLQLMREMEAMDSSQGRELQRYTTDIDTFLSSHDCR